MNDILIVLKENILPIFVVAAFGFALRRWLEVDQRPLASIVLNVLSPCLVFSSLVSSQLSGAELGRLAAFAILTILLMGGLGLVVARIGRFSRTDTAALLIVLMFVNGGNYGLTLAQLRYGDEGLSHAIVYFITSTIILYTAGVMIASMGRLHWREALKKMQRLPAVYAAVSAIVVYVFDIPLPAPLLKGVEIAADGAIPVMLLVLGMQIANLEGQVSRHLAVPAIFLRLIVGPLLAVMVAAFLGLQGIGRATSIIEASLSPAVFTIILATEFDLHPTAVTSIVVWATLLSPLTVAVVITAFGL